MAIIKPCPAAANNLSKFRTIPEKVPCTKCGGVIKYRCSSAGAAPARWSRAPLVLR